MRQTSVVDDVTRAAVELFAAQGFANTSVQQIVEAAGVTKGAMYHYFQSKDDLLFAIYERMLSLQKSHLDEIVARGGAVDDVLRAVCIDVIETSIDFLPEGTVFFRSQHMLSQPRQQEVTRRRRDYNDEFSALIEAGQQQGLYRTDIPRPVLIAHFFSDLHYLSQWYSPEGPEGKTLLAEQITALFLRSIAAEPAEPGAPEGATDA
ncbi:MULTISPECIES: TetR/AcrR family transcriptional regulator [unclassified Leifsonia]|uniref:TetR/AcrR family transcriptional regulator n=1 Tax=unclassified Leifsonia TaxID=2663824 RepID=UPI0006F91C54|nr:MULTISPECIES: TetR/AcrR family transcriptional regulator [unclassified Leifsonia]KQX08116.1 TetR family transcriptional regulator [Leifsonia sp. Root1293]KRA12397.1 TetR family transcriptional regulator [Leifsonia sp. Root60]